MMTIKKEVIPAIDCPLSGAYLIEASAGTGKTWTLTGIILRLLLEKKINPERMVATTFTRAAAAEMKERLYENLMQFYDVCLWAKNNEVMLYQMDNEQKKAFFDDKKDTVPQLDNDIYRHLILQTLNQSPTAFDELLRRVQILLVSLDKLFIGTLDSLAQKWLKEFGQNESLEILPNPEREIETIVHDALRYLHYDAYHHSPLVYSMMDKDIFANHKKMIKITQNALNFFISEIDAVEKIDDKILLNKVNELSTLCASIDVERFNYFLGGVEQLKSFKFSVRNALTKQFHHLPNLIKKLIAIKDKEGDFFSELDSEEKDLIIAFTQKNKDTIFNKGYDQSIYDLWHALPFDDLIAIKQSYDEINGIGKSFEQYIIYVIALTLRQRLANVLAENKQTSFTLQMVKLLSLLSGKKGEKIAQHIRHLYPVALIDETQDINGEQAQLLYQIYLSPNAKKSLFELSDKGFLLCVGDPKQAIYRFRGGDVANYNYLKSLGLNTDFILSTNRRSNAKIIDALNHWFDGFDDGFGDGINYQLISACDDKENPNIDWLIDEHQALEFLHLQAKSDKLKSVALHINTLLQSNKHILENDGYRAIQPSDIAVLLTTHSDIREMQTQLKAFNIDSKVLSEQNVFATTASLHLLQLMEAVLDNKEQKLTSVLTGLYGYSLKKSQELLADNKKRSEFLFYLKRILFYWQKYGIGSALNTAFEKPALIKDTFWVYLAKFDNSERYLTDLWQLFDKISTWQSAPELFLQEFAKAKESNAHQRLALPSESGVSIMTIHASKGLEFTIVYLLDLEKNIGRAESKLYPYTENNIRKLSVKNAKGDDEKYYENCDKKEELDEKKRLGYVALTRAKEQAYVVVQNKKQNGKNAMNDWGFFDEKGTTVVIPERMNGCMSFIALDEFLDGNQITTSYQKISENINTEHSHQWQEIYKKEQFSGVHNTSFSDMVRYFDVHNEQKSDVIVSDDDVIMSGQKDKGIIQNRFMRGTTAGTYLHKVLQRISNGTDIQSAVYHTAKELSIGLDEQTQIDVLQWLQTIATTPFLASNSALINIEKKQAEFGFLMGLKENFNPDDIGHIFKKYTNHYMPDIHFEQEKILGFLKGEIDLLYCYDNKYYVVDYKSNHLNDNIEGYDEQAMSNAMNERGYWLQAVIYQVALHRLLKLRIPNYIGNESNYLGAVEYVFLRGIDESNRFGRLVWDIPFALIDELDKLFG